MRLLCAAFIDARFKQLLRKIFQQTQGLKLGGVDCSTYVFGSDELDLRGFPGLCYIRLPWSWPRYCVGLDALIQQLSPDVVYLRYPLADAALLRLVERHPHVVFEHNTIELVEAKGERLEEEFRFGSAILSKSAGICAVTEEILTHERQRAGRELPGWVMGNGIDPASVAPVAFDLPNDVIHLVCAANFSFWHGLDRLLHGMAAYRGSRRFVLHLAGTGEALPEYKTLVDQLGLQQSVRFYGWLSHDAMQRLTASCHVGVGTLAFHRMPLHEACSLKLREYCLQGLPFFFSGKDPDFEPLPVFARAVPNDDTPIDMEMVAELADAVSQQPQLRQSMRDYGECRLSWDVKAQGISKLLHQCALSPEQTIQLASTIGTPCSVAVVVTCAAGLQGLEDTVASLLAQRQVHAHGAQVELVVSVHSSDVLQVEDLLSSSGAHRAIARWQVVGNDCNHEGVMRNAALRQSRSQWFVPLLAGDQLRAGVLDALWVALGSQPWLNVLTLRGEDECGNMLMPPAWFPLTAEHALPALLMVRKSLWADMGGYDEAQPLGRADSIDLEFWIRGVAAQIFVARHHPRVGLERETGSSVSNDQVARAMLATLLPHVVGPEHVMEAHGMLSAAGDALKRTVSEVCTIRPHLALPWLWQGLLHEGAGDFSQAVACHLKALELGKNDDWQPCFRLGLLYRAQNSKSKSRVFFTEAAQRAPVLKALFDTMQERMS